MPDPVKSEEDNQNPPPAPEADEQERPKSKREQALEGIYAAREEMLAEDGVDLSEQDPDAEPTPKAEEPGADPEPDPADDAPADDASQMIKLSDGSEVSLSDLEETFQKNRNADERLAQANKTLADVQAMQAQVNEQFQKIQQPAGDEPAAAPADPGQQDATQAVLAEIDVAELGNTIQYEDPERAGQAILDAVTKAVTAAGPQANPVDAVEITNRVRGELEFSNALSEVKDQYPYIFEDDWLVEMSKQHLAAVKNMADREVEQGALKAEEYPSYREMIFAAAELTKGWMQERGMEIPDVTSLDDDVTSLDDDDPGDSDGDTPTVDVDAGQRTQAKRDAQPSPAATSHVPQPAQPTEVELTEEQSRAQGIQDVINGRRGGNRQAA